MSFEGPCRKCEAGETHGICGEPWRDVPPTSPAPALNILREQAEHRRAMLLDKYARRIKDVSAMRNGHRLLVTHILPVLDELLAEAIGLGRAARTWTEADEADYEAHQQAYAEYLAMASSTPPGAQAAMATSPGTTLACGCGRVLDSHKVPGEFRLLAICYVCRREFTAALGGMMPTWTENKPPRYVRFDEPAAKAATGLDDSLVRVYDPSGVFAANGANETEMWGKTSIEVMDEVMRSAGQQWRGIRVEGDDMVVTSTYDGTSLAPRSCPTCGPCPGGPGSTPLNETDKSCWRCGRTDLVSA